MTNAFQWILELVDRTSRPAKKAEQAVGGFDKELKKVEEQIERIKAHPVEFKKLTEARRELRELSGGSRSFAQRFEEMGNAVKRVGFVQNLMLGVEALKLGWEVGEKVVDVVYDIGKEMLGAAGSAERFKVSFGGLLGDEGGEQVLGYIEQIQKHTELSSVEIKGLSAQMLSLGFDAKELAQVLPAAFDIGALKGGGLANIQAAAEALGHIKTTGEISKRSLGALGLTYVDVMKQLRKETGLSDEGVKKLIESGKGGAQVLHAVLQSTANKEGGFLGTMAEKMAATVPAKLKKLVELPEQLFEKWSESPGFERFSKALDKILAKLDPSGPNGKKLFDALDRASMKVVDIIDKFADGDGIDKFIDAVSRAAGQIDKIPAALDKVVTVAEVLATVWVGSSIVSTVSSLTTLLPGVATAAGGATAAIGAMAAPLAALGASVFGIYETIKAIQAYSDAKKTHAESYRPDLSIWGGDGLSDEEFRAGNKSFNEQIRAARSPRPPMASNPTIPSQSSRVAANGGRGDQNATVHLTINAPGANPDEIADAVGTTLPGAMQQGMERMAVAAGAM